VVTLCDLQIADNGVIQPGDEIDLGQRGHARIGHRARL
jgi:hypothetical protein